MDSLPSRNIVDSKRLGLSLREARIAAGYPTAESLVDALQTELGYKVSKQTIYNIESGKQEPKLSLYCAIVRLTHPEGPVPLDPLLKNCVPELWSLPLRTTQIFKEASVMMTADLQQSVKRAVEAVNRSLLVFDEEMWRQLTRTLNASMTPHIEALKEQLTAMQMQKIVRPSLESAHQADDLDNLDEAEESNRHENES